MRSPVAAVAAALLGVVALLAPTGAMAATPTPSATSAGALPQVAASAWLVADLDTGEVLAAHNEHQRLAPASTLKILTAFTLLPRLDVDQRYTATAQDAAIEGSKVGLDPGSVYTVEDLFVGLMLASGNDAAHALSSLVGGQQAAADLMQEQADVLGAEDTVVVDPSGLDAPGQGSSAFDLAVIARAAMETPEFAELVATERYDFPAAGTTLGAGRERFEIQNHNRLLGSYQGALGVKNGYTVAARGSFVGAAERDGRRYVATVLRTDARPAALSADLLDWAFANGGRVEAIDTLPTASPQGDDGAGPIEAQVVGPSDPVAATTGGGVPLPVVLLGVLVVLLAGRIAWVARKRTVKRRSWERRRAAWERDQLLRDPSPST